jgi:hypothetical protein
MANAREVLLQDKTGPLDSGDVLIQPKFGVYLPMAEFASEVSEATGDAQQPLAKLLSAEHEAAEKERLLARKAGKGQEGAGAGAEQGSEAEARAGFVPAAGSGDADVGWEFGTKAEAQRLLNQKQLAEIEGMLEQAKSTAAVLWKEVEGEQDQNEKLRKLVVSLKTRKLELEDRIEDYTREIENRGAVKGKDAAEEKKFRELEARMKREEAKRKAQELGLEEEEEAAGALDAVDPFGVLRLLRKQYKDLRRWFLRVDPTFIDSRMAESRFGSGIALYFWFYRFVLYMTMALGTIWLIFLGLHLAAFIATARAALFVTLPLAPSFLLYTSIDASLMGSYGACMLTSIALLFIGVFGKLADEVMTKNSLAVQGLGQEEKRYAKLAFTAWDWGTNDAAASNDLKAAVVNNFHTLKLEDEADQRIRARTRKEWQILYARRTVGLSLNTLVLVAGIATIIAATFLFSGAGSSSAAEDGGGMLATVTGLLPTLVPTAVNGALPTITNACVDLEAWDEPTFALKMRVGRLYIGKILNAIIQVLIIVILFRGPEGLGGVAPRIKKRSCSYISCEDEVGVMLFQLFVTDVVVGSLASYGQAVGQYMAYTRVLNDPLKAKKEFEPPKEFIKILYQQVFVWLMLPFYPFGVILALLFWVAQVYPKPSTLNPKVYPKP